MQKALLCISWLHTPSYGAARRTPCRRGDLTLAVTINRPNASTTNNRGDGVKRLLVLLAPFGGLGRHLPRMASLAGKQIVVKGGQFQRLRPKMRVVR